MLELVSFSGYLGPNMWILLDNTLQIYIWTLLGRFLFRNIARRGAVRCGAVRAAFVNLQAGSTT